MGGWGESMVEVRKTVEEGGRACRAYPAQRCVPAGADGDGMVNGRCGMRMYG
jgi:hypothetical protein